MSFPASPAFRVNLRHFGLMRSLVVVSAYGL